MKDFFNTLEGASEWKILALIVCFAAALYLTLISNYPLADIMEARNLVSARECVEDGNCIVTTFNGVPRVKKPPLPTWAAALAMKVAGSTSAITSARVPNIFIVALMGVFVYLFSRRWLGRGLALSVTLVSLTSLLLSKAGGRITWDIYALSFACGGVWAMLKALEREEGRRIGLWILISGALWGLSFLSKGPATIGPMMLPFLLALAISPKRFEYRWWTLVPIGVITCIIGVSWWAYIYNFYPETFTVIKGEVSGWSSKHDAGYLFYLPFPLLFFPWTLALIAAIIMPFIKFRDGMTLLTGEKRREHLFFLIWFILSIAVLTIVPQKKARYAITAILPASVLVGFFLREIKENALKTAPGALRFLWRGQALMAPLMLLFLIAAAVYGAVFTGSPIYVLLVVPVAILFLLKIIRGTKTVGYVIALMFPLMLLFNLTLMVLVRDVVIKDGSQSIEGAARVSAITGDKDLYIMKRTDKLVWATGRKNIPITGDTVIEETPAYMLVNKKRLPYFKDWASKKGLAYREAYRFNFKDLYILFLISQGSDTEP